LNPLATSQESNAGFRDAEHRRSRRGHLQWPIEHVVVVVQENRTVDNLFQFLPGANTQSYGLNSQNQEVPLQAEDLAAPCGFGHAYGNFQTEYDNGQMNGFERETHNGTCPSNPAYAYVPQKQVQPYYTLAETYAFADDMFSSDEGPSYPGHQYIISGTSSVSEDSLNKASGNPLNPNGSASGGCDSPPGTLVQVINPKGQMPKDIETFPCYQRESIMDEMDAADVTWKYYQNTPGAGLWHAVDSIYSIWAKPGEMSANVITPPTQALTDIENGNLADVVWITPTDWYSDHPNGNDGSGPSWVAAIVNAIGSSSYWQNTAIFVTWDDWGGLYDHVTPTIYNSFELGFRVPLIVVSPYAKPGYVSHVQHEYGSILHFTEEAFGLPSLGTTDARADDLSDCFDFSQPMRKFRPIPAKYPPAYFFHLPITRNED
jgi:phospholipase C